MNLDTSKPIFLMSQGPTIGELSNWMDKFKDLDVYWASYNRFDLVQHLLHDAGKHLNIVYLYSFGRILETREDICEFLELGEDRLLVYNTCPHCGFSNSLLEKDSPVSFILDKHNTETISSKEAVESGTMLHSIVALYGLGFKNFCLFGVDGNNSLYGYKHYRDEEYIYDIEETNPSGIDEIKNINEREWWHLFQNTQNCKDEQGYVDEKDITILNCNKHSLITRFPRIEHKDVVRLYG